MRRPIRPVETHVLDNVLTAAVRAVIGPGRILQMGCMILINWGELFVGYGIMAHCVLRSVGRGMHTRHTGYAAACLGFTPD